MRQGGSQSTGNEWSMVSDNETHGTDDLSTPGGGGWLRAAARRQGSSRAGCDDVSAIREQELELHFFLVCMIIN